MKKIILAILVMMVLCSFYIYAQGLTPEEKQEEIERIRLLPPTDLANEIVEGTIKIPYSEIAPSQLAGAIAEDDNVMGKLDAPTLRGAIDSRISLLDDPDVFSLYDTRALTDLRLLDDDDIMQKWAEKRGIRNIEKGTRLTDYMGTTFSTEKLKDFPFEETIAKYHIDLFKDGSVELYSRIEFIEDIETGEREPALIGRFTGEMEIDPKTGNLITRGGKEASLIDRDGYKISCSDITCQIIYRPIGQEDCPTQLTCYEVIAGSKQIISRAEIETPGGKITPVSNLLQVTFDALDPDNNEISFLAGKASEVGESRGVVGSGYYNPDDDIYTGILDFYDPKLRLGDYAGIESGEDTRIKLVYSKEDCVPAEISCIVTDPETQTMFVRTRNNLNLNIIKSPEGYENIKLDSIPTGDGSVVSVLREDLDGKLVATHDFRGLHTQGPVDIEVEYVDEKSRLVSTQIYDENGGFQCVGETCRQGLLACTE
jgi:hypothetical protein